MLSALCTGRLCSQEILLVLISIKRLSRLQRHSAAGTIKSMKNPSDPIANRTRDFPVCGAVFQFLTHKILFYNKFITFLYMFRAPRVHHQEVKIVLYSIWYHHTETSEWSKITKIQFYKYEFLW